MDNTKEPVKKLKRPKSATRYPKRTNTYVVAFASQEPSVENIPKTKTSSKRIPENSIASNESLSVTDSTTSTKTITVSPINDLSHPLIVPTISEVKIDILDGNQYSDTEKKSLQTNNFQEVDIKMVDEQPQIIFNASKNIKRCKEHRQPLRKKPKSYRRVVKFKSINFKYKNSKNVITRSIEKYYVKAKMNTSHSGQYISISRVISRSGILKNVFAKENLLAGEDLMWMLDMSGLNDNCNLPLNTSGALCTPSVSSSYGSQNTLVNDSSFSLQSDDLYSIKTVNSVVPISTDTTPYNTDISIAVAIGFTSLKPNNDQSDCTISSNEESSNKDNVTSTDTMSFSGMELTSQVPSDDSANKTFTREGFMLNEKYVSSETLAGFGKKMSNAVSDDDTFVMGRTLSDSDKSSNCSASELASISEIRVKPDNLAAKEIKSHVSQKVTLLDTLVHLGSHPEMTPSTSSGANFDNSMDDVLSKDKKESLTIQNQLSKNVLKKSFEIETKDIYNNISLPNEAAIKAMLKNDEKSQKKTPEELKGNNLPLDMIEIWNRLSLVLDLAIKRLEETITENIIREIKKSLSSIVMKNTDEIDDLFLNSKGIKTCEVIMSSKGVLANEEILGTENHQGHQCDLVQNQVIDQLMLKLSVEGPRTLNSSLISLKSLKKPQNIRDYFDIIKQPTDECDVEVGKGDTVTVSTATVQGPPNKYAGREGFSSFIVTPIYFLRENLLVITSVPIFFLILFCLYGIITLIKPW